MKNEMKREEIIKKIDDFINDLAYDVMKNCKSGDIDFDQVFELDNLQGKIADILLKVREQNIKGQF